jgi:PAS domain S-box-containing protein
VKPGDLVGPVVVHSADAICYANEAFCALVGLDSRDGAIQESLSQFVADSHRDALAEQFERLEEDGVPTLGLTLELETADGERCEVIAVSSRVEWDEQTQIHTTFIDTAETRSAKSVSLRETAMHQAPVGITIADMTREDEPLIYVNDVFVELTGYPRDEIIGQNCRFLQGEETRAEPVTDMRAAIDARDPVTVELRNYRKDGSLFWNRVTLSPVYDESGACTHYLGFQEDITETKVYERERSLFEKHAEASDQVMLVMDRQGTIEYVNPAFERVTGYTAEDVVGEKSCVLEPDRQDEAFYEELWETMEAGETRERTLTNRTKHGELYQIHQTVVPITDDRGEITHFVAIERDVTDEQLTEQVLDVLNRILRHNVRTSINVIDGYAESLHDEVDSDEQRAAAQAIRDRTGALKKLNEQLTVMRSLIEGRSEPSPLPISAIGKILDKARAQHDDAVISVTIQAPADRTIKNGHVFQIALETAIENAVTHCEEVTPEVEITVQEHTSEDTAVVEIADNGPGIPEPEWEVIKAGTETPLQHTSGVGLWILYWSVTALGGTVEKSPNDPQGTRLTIEVPLEPATD